MNKIKQKFRKIINNFKLFKVYLFTLKLNTYLYNLFKNNFSFLIINKKLKLLILKVF